MSRLTRNEALNILARCEIDPEQDFHALYSGKVAMLGKEARMRKYNRPKNANGSTARCFHAYIMRTIG